MATKKTPKSYCVVEGEGKWTIEVEGDSLKFQFCEENFWAEIRMMDFRERVDYVRGAADRDKPTPIYDHFADVMARRGFFITGD